MNPPDTFTLPEVWLLGAIVAAGFFALGALITRAKLKMDLRAMKDQAWRTIEDRMQQREDEIRAEYADSRVRDFNQSTD